MPLVTRIACGVSQNMKHVRSLRMKHVQKNMSANENNNNKISRSATVPLYVPITDDEDIRANGLERKVESNFQSQNDNLKMITKIVDEGDRIIVQTNTEWFDPKSNKVKKQISQTVYDI